MFINFTNHSSEKWSGEQRMAAERYGEIVDIPFPSVPPRIRQPKGKRACSSIYGAYLRIQARRCSCSGGNDPELCGVSMLLSFGINALSATTERVSESRIGSNGETVKVSEFRFARFREYFRQN